MIHPLLDLVRHYPHAMDWAVNANERVIHRLQHSLMWLTELEDKASDAPAWCYCNEGLGRRHLHGEFRHRDGRIGTLYFAPTDDHHGASNGNTPRREPEPATSTAPPHQT